MGNNPTPLITAENARCCDECNKVVMFVRLAMMRFPHQPLNRTNWIRAIRRNDPDVVRIRGMFGGSGV